MIPKERKNNITNFISKNKNLWILTVNNGYTSEVGKIFIKIARKKLKYSNKTGSMDIYRTLININNFN